MITVMIRKMKQCLLQFLIVVLCLACFVSCTSPSVPNTIETDVQTTVNADISSDEQTEDATSDMEPEVDIDNTIKIGEFLDSLSALQYGYTESGLSVQHVIEVEYSDNTFHDENVAQTITVSVRGVEYELKYAKSYAGPRYHDTYHEYESPTVYAYIDAETGNCIHLFSASTQAENEDSICPYEEQMEIAKAFLADQVEDPEYYIIIDESRTPTGILYVTFTRAVGTLNTYEEVKVKVDQIGEIPMYYLHHIGEMKDVPTVPEEIIQRVYSILKTRARHLYGCLEDKGYEWEDSTIIDRLVRLDNGSLALECHVDVVTTNSNGHRLSDSAWFIIPITEPTQ